MRDYHSYEKRYIGGSDVAALVFIGCRDDEPVDSTIVHFGSDGEYYAYIVDSDAEIGNHYHKVVEYDRWMKIYDDEGLTYKSPHGNHVNVYRAGDYGVIIQINE